MMVLVTGGSGSGKSAYAENEILNFTEGQRFYIATMRCFDEEGKKRVARHRLMRKEKNFETIECYTGLKKLRFPVGAIVLLECMSNLTANEMYEEDGAREHAMEEIIHGVSSLVKQVSHLVIVTNEIFSDGIPYDPETMKYIECLGKINQQLSGMADKVVEVVCSIPLIQKEG